MADMPDASASRATSGSRLRSGGWRRRRDAADDRLGFAAAAAFGVVCAVGVLDLVAGAVLLALFAAAGSIRKLRRNVWPAALFLLAAVVSRFHPPIAVALAFATIALLLARAWFVVANLRVVVLGLAAYALAGASFLELVPRLRTVLASGAAPAAVAGVDPARIGAPLALVIGAAFMTAVLAYAGRRGDPPGRALEVMSVLPTIAAGLVAPFATGAFVTAGVDDLAASTGALAFVAAIGERAEAAVAAVRAYAAR